MKLKVTINLYIFDIFILNFIIIKNRFKTTFIKTNDISSSTIVFRSNAESSGPKEISLEV